MTPTILLGDRVRDQITSYEGIVTARCEYLYGVTRLLVQSETAHEGKVVELWFDEPALIPMKEAKP